MKTVRSAAVFCGSSADVAEHHLTLARAVGETLAGHGVRVVYGGGDSGLMGAVADGAMTAGGEVIGVIPGGLFSNGITHEAITSLEVVDSMHERKARMYELADAFIGLPGGLGTLEEIFEAATWTQIGLHADGPKHVVLVDLDGFWSSLIDFLDLADREGFLRATNRAIISRATSIDELGDQLGLR